jgi:ABC-type uncharacterized transport system ATPase subunit
VIHAGERVVYGALRDVRRAHSAPVVRVRIDGELPELPGLERVTEDGDRLELHLAPGTSPRELLEALVVAKVPVHHFEEVLATMEEIFLRAVRGESAPMEAA